MASAAAHPDRLPAGARTICAAAERLPLADASADLVWSNLMLAYCPDPRPVIAEARRVLRARGLFSFTTLGRGSFAELSEAWAEADDFVHVAAQPDMHDLGDLLVRGGFSEPVLDTEVLTVTYESLADLARDLRSAAAVNRSGRRNRGLTGRGVAKRLQAALEKRRDRGGRFAITIELIFAQAWVGAELPTAARDSIEVPLSAIVRRRIDPDHSK
jgi:malonyl-CoA O-methyltransferase